MRQKPKMYVDSFWGDLVNALTLRPVYRAPVEARQSTATVTLHSDVAEQASAVQEAVKADASSTAEQMVHAGSTAGQKVNASGTVQDKVNATSTVQQKVNPATTVADAIPKPRPARAETINHETGGSEAPLGTNWESIPATYPVGKKPFFQQEANPMVWRYQDADHPKVQSLGEFQRSKEPGIPVVRKLPPTLGDGYYTISMKPGDDPGHTTAAIMNEFDRLLDIATKEVSENVTSNQPWVKDPGTVLNAVRQVLRRKLKAEDLRKIGFSQREADILEGMFHLKKFRTIAAQLGDSSASVRYTVKELMGKFEVEHPNELLKAVRSMHQDAQHPKSVRLGGLSLSIKHDAGASNDLVVVRQPRLFTERPTHSEIPEGHPDHPANDKGAKKRPGQEGKKTPAHSTESTPPPLRED